jgi:hypothetical protein
MHPLLLGFTALAVLLVSITCIPGGCLLVAISQHESGQSVCCEHRNDSRHDAPVDGGNCPLCQGSTLLAKTVEKNLSHVGSAGDLLPLCVANVFCVFNPAALPARISRASVDHFPTAGPPTLLALHCSLVV